MSLRPMKFQHVLVRTSLHPRRDAHRLRAHHDTSPLQAPRRLSQAPEGTFEFSLRPVDRKDRIETSITGLLLDIAREQDEANR